MTARVERNDLAGVVLDIEGTTTPVAFVYDVLFPFARARLGEFVAANAGTPEFREIERMLRVEWAEDVLRGEAVPPWPDSISMVEADVTGYLAWLMERDRKSTALKIVQGRIWETGFRDGTLRGEVFDDVPRALARWHDAGLAIAIYSSGSVLAQQLLFSHSVAGDLTPYLSRYFDTAVGGKRVAASYVRIALELDQPARRLLFVSDVKEELDAAAAAGFQTVLCVRDGASTQGNRRVIHSFDELF